MTDVLILGGTGWLGGRVATAWLDAGASVTCLARGGRDAPYGERLVRAEQHVVRHEDRPVMLDPLLGEWLRRR